MSDYSNLPEVPIGAIFCQTKSNGSKSYWKVVGPANKVGYISYPVVKCSSTGKEYKFTNYFDAHELKCTYAKVAGWMTSKFFFVKITDNVQKANIQSGIESGKIKRRISYLKRMIQVYQNELKEIE